MLKRIFRIYVLLLLSLYGFACSEIGIQSKKEGTTPDSAPDCQKNCTGEGGLITRPIYKTWVKYDHLDLKNGFDLAVKTLQSQGHWIISTDPGSGTITVQMLLETEQKEGYPATVKISEEGSSLVVHMSLKATWGRLTSPNLCGFYDELGKNVKQASLRAQIKQPVLTSPKPSEGAKESPLPPPCPTPSSSPPPAAVPKMSTPLLPQGNVVWVYVNLREGPGTQYEIIGKAYMKNSFAILAENPGWLRVRLENGAEGWVSKKAVILDTSVTSSPQGPSASSTPSSGSKLPSKPLSPM